MDESPAKKTVMAMKNFVRFLTIPVVALGVIAALQPPNCSGNTCPTYALANAWVLRTERGLFAIVVSLALLTIIVKLVVEGELPDQIGRDVLGWKTVAKEIEVSTDEILDYVISIDDDLQEFKSHFPTENVDVEPTEPTNLGGP